MNDTERCSLRPLAESDFAEAAGLFTDENVRKYLGGTITEAAAREKLAKWLTDGESIYFTVRLLADGSFVGIVDVSPHHDRENKELSYQFLPQHWGMGLAAEVLENVLEYCRDELGIRKVVSETQTANVRSCRLLEKLGYTLVEQFERYGARQNLYVKELT